jgi:hypothetical protein
MITQLLIGKNSDGEDQYIDLEKIPVLIISYCEEDQLKSIFSQFNLFDFVNKNYLIANTRFFKNWGLNKNHFHLFMRDDPKIDFETRIDLIDHLLEEIVNRQKIMKKKKIIDFERYVSLNTWNDIKLGHQFLIVDDVWDIIVSKPVKLGLNFMMIILYGPIVGIHTIFASVISYRNILEQMINQHPILTIELRKKYGFPEPKKISELGQELIFTPEGFVYYKKSAISDLLKLYKL